MIFSSHGWMETNHLGLCVCFFQGTVFIMDRTAPVHPHFGIMEGPSCAAVAKQIGWRFPVYQPLSRFRQLKSAFAKLSLGLVKGFGIQRLDFVGLRNKEFCRTMGVQVLVAGFMWGCGYKCLTAPPISIKPKPQADSDSGSTCHPS